MYLSYTLLCWYGTAHVMCRVPFCSRGTADVVCRVPFCSQGRYQDSGEKEAEGKFLIFRLRPFHLPCYAVSLCPPSHPVSLPGCAVGLCPPSDHVRQIIRSSDNQISVPSVTKRCEEFESRNHVMIFRCVTRSVYKVSRNDCMCVLER